VTKFVIKEFVRTTKGVTTQIAYQSEYERAARMSMKEIARDNPNTYFELLKVEHSEELLMWTPYDKDGSGKVLPPTTQSRTEFMADTTAPAPGQEGGE
jgi:hypothetical protein